MQLIAIYAKLFLENLLCLQNEIKIRFWQMKRVNVLTGHGRDVLEIEGQFFLFLFFPKARKQNR